MRKVWKYAAVLWAGVLLRLPVFAQSEAPGAVRPGSPDTAAMVEIRDGADQSPDAVVAPEAPDTAGPSEAPDTAVSDRTPNTTGLISTGPEEELSAPDAVATSEAPDTAARAGGLDLAHLIFGHIEDHYEWEIARFGKKELVLSLPVIVRSSRGVWHIFPSSRLKDGLFEGFLIAPEGSPYAGRVVELTDGGFVRPADFSITKNVLAILFSSGLLLLLVLLTARWYRHHDSLREAPSGLAAVMEPIVMMVHEMARENIGERDFRKFSPFLCLVFLFILLNNFLGILPFFPGGANVTGNIAVTLVLALFTFFTVQFHGTRHYYKEMLNPDVPVFLKPIMPLIEVFSAIMKPISLTIRLFANMLAGHIQLLSIVCIIFIMVKYGAVMTGSISVVSVLFGIFLDVLEILISFIQAYVFTTLSSIYIGIARQRSG